MRMTPTRVIRWAALLVAVSGLVFTVVTLGFPPRVDLEAPGFRTYVGSVSFRATRYGLAAVLDGDPPVWLNCAAGRLAFGCLAPDDIPREKPVSVTYVETKRTDDLVVGVLRSVGVNAEGDVLSVEERSAQIEPIRRGSQNALLLSLSLFAGLLMGVRWMWRRA